MSYSAPTLPAQPGDVPTGAALRSQVQQAVASIASVLRGAGLYDAAAASELAEVASNPAPATRATYALSTIAGRLLLTPAQVAQRIADARAALGREPTGIASAAPEAVLVPIWGAFVATHTALVPLASAETGGYAGLPQIRPFE
jgi:hypothetical protein